MRPKEIRDCFRSFPAVLVLLSLGVGSLLRAEGPSDWLAPSKIESAQGCVWIAAERGKAVLRLDDQTLEEIGRYPIEGKLTGLFVSSHQVLLTTEEGWLIALDSDSGRILNRWPLPAGVCAPLQEEERIMLCDRFGDSVLFLDATTGRLFASVAAIREPVAIATWRDSLVALNLLPVGPATADYVASSITIISRDTFQVSTNLLLPSGGILPRGIAVVGDRAFIVHSLARFKVPTTQISQGWMNSSALTVMDLAQSRLVGTVLLDESTRGAANPWDIDVTPDGRFLIVAHAGTHELSVIEMAALMEKLEKTKSDGRVIEDLAFLKGIRRRVRLSGKGPRSVCVAGDRAFVTEFFSDSVAVVDIGKAEQIASVNLGTGGEPDVLQWGEQLFHDASIGYEGWQSCASCHPDGRVDGLNWDLLNDGIGNPKNTRSLLMSHQTGPAMSLGVRASAETAVRAGFRHILFTRRPEEELTAVDRYLDSMRPLPSPHLVSGDLSEAARRGKVIYDKAGCASCHPEPLFTDRKSYDVRTANRWDGTKRAFDTPTLVEAWRTAPYLHDGSAATLEDVFRMNRDDQHGKTSPLSQSQLADLLAYVLSL